LKVHCQLLHDESEGGNLGEDDRVELLKLSFTGDAVLGASTAPTIGTAISATTSDAAHFDLLASAIFIAPPQFARSCAGPQLAIQLAIQCNFILTDSTFEHRAGSQI
jgi:hypothetical protein